MAYKNNEVNILSHYLIRRMSESFYSIFLKKNGIKNRDKTSYLKMSFDQLKRIIADRLA